MLKLFTSQPSAPVFAAKVALPVLLRMLGLPMARVHPLVSVGETLCWSCFSLLVVIRRPYSRQRPSSLRLTQIRARAQISAGRVAHRTSCTPEPNLDTGTKSQPGALLIGLVTHRTSCTPEPTRVSPQSLQSSLCHRTYRSVAGRTRR